MRDEDGLAFKYRVARSEGVGKRNKESAGGP